MSGRVSSFDIFVADADDAPEISALLLASGLQAWRPGDDQDEDQADVLAARDADDRLVGCAVLLTLGNVGLLRSVAVAADVRGSGLGRALAEAVLDRPAARRLGSVYLLTTTAAGFFGRLGFDRVDRRDVDPVIQGTHQYREECPATAVVMRRRGHSQERATSA